MLRSGVVAVVSVLGLIACSGGPPVESSETAQHDFTAGPSGGRPTSSPSAAPATADKPLVVHSLANLGDSISQGFDADDSTPMDLTQLGASPESVLHDNPTLSWVQGSDPRIGSVAHHYGALDPRLVVTPLSRAGAELVSEHDGLPNFEQQARSLGTAGVAPDLVYVLLGGNDVCGRAPSTTSDAAATLYSVDEWRAAVVAGLTALAEVLPRGATVRSVSMPRVDLLYDVLGAAEVPARFDSPLGPVASVTDCKTLWTLTSKVNHPICSIVTTEGSPERRAMIGARIDAYNDALAEEVRRFDGDVTRNPKRIAFQSDWHGSLARGAAKNSSVGTLVFEPQHISKLDCFHPSIDGQREIADLVLRRAVWKP
jgi:lysophospholipase L1-like esterase